MTVSVNKIVILKNYLTPCGRTANNIMKEFKGNSFWQKSLDDGSIALQTGDAKKYSQKNIFILINSNGRISQKTTKIQCDNTNLTSHFAKKWYSVKMYWNSLGEKLKTIISEKYFINGNLDEKASRTVYKNGSVKTSVTSYKNRISEFPQTKIANNMHPRMWEKIKEIDEGMTYIEKYPCN